MRLIITDQASQAIIKELALQADDGVRFFGKQVPGQPVNHDHKQGYAKDIIRFAPSFMSTKMRLIITLTLRMLGFLAVTIV